MTYQNSATVNIIDWSPLPLNPVAQYYLLEPHYINNIYYEVGTIVSEGSQIPIGWIPTPNVDPLNAPATNAFYALGPRVLGPIRTQYVNFPVHSPVTYWVQVSPTQWALTGLGASLAPVHY